jgi:predicted nucleotidyltransferase component of viral defense system
MKYIDLTDLEQQEIVQRVQAETGLNQQIIEKDWWVTTVLRALFSLPYANHLSLKGGTSLSKCWNLIRRFSEDADIGIEREYLGLGGTLSKTQISDKLRRASCAFVREKMQVDLREKLIENGINENKFTVKVHITPVTTTDPEIIEIEYQSVFSELQYIKRKVIIEVSGRSMDEPITHVHLSSVIDEVYKTAPFTEPSFDVRAVAPERTFWEKICLLQEEFAKPREAIRTERMSRHLYDIVQIMQSPVASKALNDTKLYESVIEHRRTFIGLKGFDYSLLRPQAICIVPPAEIMDSWKKDYETMQETMIYGESLPFDKMIEQITELNKTLNNLQ